MFRRLWTRTARYRPDLSDYLNPAFLNRIDPGSVRTIFELGCEDGTDTLQLRDAFDATVHAFECNPHVLPAARRRLAGEPRVRLVETAVWDSDGEIPFYPVVQAREDGREVRNPGASSCFRARSDYRQHYVQDEVVVEATRLDTYCSHEDVPTVDLLCIDVQGAALRALKGLGSYIQGVLALIVEIEHREIFRGEDLYPEVHAFLEASGLRQAVEVERDDWFSDFLYVRE